MHTCVGAGVRVYGCAFISACLPACVLVFLFALQHMLLCWVSWGQSWWSALPARQAVTLEDCHPVTLLSVSLISHLFDVAVYIKAVMWKTLSCWTGPTEKNTKSQVVMNIILDRLLGLVKLQHFLFQLLCLLDVPQMFLRLVCVSTCLWLAVQVLLHAQRL